MSDPSAHSGNTQYIGNMPSSGGGGGGGTPNVAIAGSDPNGNLIASPVLTGDAGNTNLSMIGGNTNTGFRSTALGGNNSVEGSNNFVSGYSNIQGNGSSNGIIGESNEIKDVQGQNLVVGNSNTVDASSCLVGGRLNTVDKVSGASTINLVVGASNHVTDSALNAVSGNGHTLQNSTLFTQVSGNANKLNNVVNSQVSGYNNDVSSLSGTGADFNDISGANNVVKGDYCRVSGGYNNVQAVNASVDGTGHVVAGNNSATEGSSNTVGANASNAHAEGAGNTASGATSHVQGEGNTAKFAQHVAGRYAVVDPIAVDTVPTAGQNVEIVGWGTNDANRKTIRSLRADGHEQLFSSIGFDTQTKGIVGSNGSANKAAGYIGEAFKVEIPEDAAVSVTSGAILELFSLAVTGGLYAADLNLNFIITGATTLAANPWKAAIATSPVAAMPTDGFVVVQSPVVLTAANGFFNMKVFSFQRRSAPATLVGALQIAFTVGTVKVYGYLKFARVG